MGVDLVGIIGHSLSKKEILNLPNVINNWMDVNDYYTAYSKKSNKKAEWDGVMNEEQLELIWEYYESIEIDKNRLDKLENFDSVIDCGFGTISIYRKTILISHWNHKYSNLRDPDTAKNILTLNRMLSKRLSRYEIIYCTDSGYPTQAIEEKAVSGLSFEELKEFAINTFGTPPLHLDDARKYMFFIDNLNNELSDFTLWDGDNPYWHYDFEKRDYILIKRLEKKN